MYEYIKEKITDEILEKITKDKYEDISDLENDMIQYFQESEIFNTDDFINFARQAMIEKIIRDSIDENIDEIENRM